VFVVLFRGKILCRFAQSYSSKQILKQQLHKPENGVPLVRVTVGMPSRVVKSVPDPSSSSAAVNSPMITQGPGLSLSFEKAIASFFVIVSH
jgi:hypothetical protein